MAIKQFYERVTMKEQTAADIELLQMATEKYLTERITFKLENANDARLGGPLRCKHQWLQWHARSVPFTGPLCHLQTNAAEAKNGQLRTMSEKANQTNNVLRTIATRCIGRNAIRQRHTGNEPSAILWKERTEFEVNNEYPDMETACHISTGQFQWYKKMQWFGFKYEGGKNLILIHGRPSRPKVGLLKLVAKATETGMIHFLTRTMRYKKIPHLGLYRCIEREECDFFPLTDLLSIRPLQLYRCQFVDNSKLAFSLSEMPVGCAL